MLRQSSLGGNAHRAFPFAAELRVEARPAGDASTRLRPVRFYRFS